MQIIRWFAFGSVVISDSTGHCGDAMADVSVDTDAVLWSMNRYDLSAAGIPGNDDFGTLSSWLLWAVAGLYPMAGTDRFILGAPRFPSMRISRVAPARDLCITAHGVTVAGNIYVQRVELEGTPLPSPFVTFSALGGQGKRTTTSKNSTAQAGGAGSGGGGQSAGCVALDFWMGSDPAGPWDGV